MDLDEDRELLEDIFDDADMRYIILYIYLVRFNIFKNLEDEDVNSAFDTLFDPDYKDQITVRNISKLLPGEIIEEMFEFNMILNIRDYAAFLEKDDDFEVKLADIYIDESMEHILFSEQSILRIVKNVFPKVTQKTIRDALKKLRAVMCQVSSCTHSLVHKYNKDFALDDELYQIIFFLGNPYLALRLERLVVAMENKLLEIEADIDKFLKIFYIDTLKSSFLKKLSKSVDWAAEKGKENDLLEYIIIKSRNLPKKFEPVEVVKNSDEYIKWREFFNQFLKFKYQCINAHEGIEKIRSIYSGPNQSMSYLTFIEEVTNNEDELSTKVRNSLVKIRSNLKEANDAIDSISTKEIKLLNLDLERIVIENDEEEDE